MSVHFSSKTPEWETPQEFFNELDKEFGFDLDVCATFENKKCKNWLGYGPGKIFCDGLKHNWKDAVCWMNPPYGREIGKWVKKAYEESQSGAKVVVCLLPSRTDTRWFHDYIQGKAEIRFIRGRLKFGGSQNAAPFPSMVVVYHGQQESEVSQ